MAAATLDDILTKVSAQDDKIAKFDTALINVVEVQGRIDKALAALPVQYPNGDPKIAAIPRDSEEEGRCGFKSFGHYLKEVQQSGKTINTCTEQMKKSMNFMVEKAIASSSETIGSDGGFLVPPTFNNKILARMYDDSALLPKTDQYSVSGNQMVFPRSAESSRATGSRWGGVQAYWTQEGGQLTLSKPTFGRLQLNLNKLTCFGAMTSELLDDNSSAMEQYMLRAFGDEINFAISDAIIEGTGVGQPQGIIGAPCKISVPKEGGQLAATIVPQNVVKMFSRLFTGNLANAVWLYNQDIEPQLFLMVLAMGTSGLAVYMPPGGLSGKPYATLMGLPMRRIEQASTLGTEGDLILVDLSSYVTITKGGPNTATSMHFYFDTDQQAFRVTFRMDGQPWQHAPLTPFKGTATVSSIVTLATRA